MTSPRLNDVKPQKPNETGVQDHAAPKPTCPYKAFLTGKLHLMAIVFNYREFLAKGVYFTTVMGLAHVLTAILPLLFEPCNFTIDNNFYFELIFAFFCFLGVAWKSPYPLFFPFLVNIFISISFAIAFIVAGLVAIFPRSVFARQFVGSYNDELITTGLFNFNDYRLTAIVVNLAMFGALILSLSNVLFLIMSIRYYQLIQKDKAKKTLLPVYLKSNIV